MPRLFQLCYAILLLALIMPWQACAQPGSQVSSPVKVLDSAGLATMFEKPPCLTGFMSNQSGPLTRIGKAPGEPDDSTFRVEHLTILSDGILINGWLYLPLGDERCPLVVLTNGGGDDSRPIRNFSDWLAPILAHCGIAAFVHDKRGTGASGGVYRETTYDDYIRDAGTCAAYLAKHPRVDSERVGVAGASEGGRVAVVAASRYPEIRFVASLAGTFVSMVDDRIYAQTGYLKGLGLPDSTFQEVLDLHAKSIRAWASEDTLQHEDVKRRILEMRQKYDRSILPFTKREMDSIPDFALILPTWNSLSSEYMMEMEHFTKPWLAVFGAEDIVVPAKASVENIMRYMEISGNGDCTVAVLPNCGHAPVDTQTHRLVRVDHIIINWIHSLSAH